MSLILDFVKQSMIQNWRCPTWTFSKKWCFKLCWGEQPDQAEDKEGAKIRKSMRRKRGTRRMRMGDEDEDEDGNGGDNEGEDNGRRTAGDGHWTTNYGRRTKDDGRATRAMEDGRLALDDE